MECAEIKRFYIAIMYAHFRIQLAMTDHRSENFQRYNLWSAPYCTIKMSKGSPWLIDFRFHSVISVQFYHCPEAT